MCDNKLLNVRDSVSPFYYNMGQVRKCEQEGGLLGMISCKQDTNDWEAYNSQSRTNKPTAEPSKS